MKKDELKIATDIETERFYEIVRFLKAERWKLKREYSSFLFDKGIDFDFYEFVRQDETIRLAWDNWFEGEMEARSETLTDLAERFRFELKCNQPEYLNKPDWMESMRGLIK